MKAEGARVFQAFLREALPEVAEAERSLAGDLLTTTLGAVGKQFSEQPRSEAEIERYAGALADMLCAYLAALGGALRCRVAGAKPSLGPAAPGTRLARA